MVARKLKISHCVVECSAVKKHDICVSANVVGVTGFAGLILESRCSAMEAGARRNIVVNRFVAVAAQPVLGFFLKAGMATRALGLILCVPGYQLARHEQSLDIGGLQSGCRKQAHGGQ